MFPVDPRRRAIERAVAFVTERLNGEDGLVGIFPAMANALMMFDCLGYSADHPDRATAASAFRKLLVSDSDHSYAQPCLSPVWDSALACHALMEVGDARLTPSIGRAIDWLADKQVLDTVGDSAATRPGLRPGGWAFQYANPHYPDLDDTAAVALALDRFDGPRYREAIDRAEEWVLGSTPTTCISISTIFRSPITARCSTRRAPMSARAASAFSPSAAPRPTVPPWPRRSHT